MACWYNDRATPSSLECNSMGSWKVSYITYQVWLINTVKFDVFCFLYSLYSLYLKHDYTRELLAPTYLSWLTHYGASLSNKNVQLQLTITRKCTFEDVLLNRRMHQRINVFQHTVTHRTLRQWNVKHVLHQMVVMRCWIAHRLVWKCRKWLLLA